MVDKEVEAVVIVVVVVVVVAVVVVVVVVEELSGLLFKSAMPQIQAPSGVATDSRLSEIYIL